MYCPNCGTQIPDGSASCQFCGETFAVTEDARGDSQPEATQAQQYYPPVQEPQYYEAPAQPAYSAPAYQAADNVNPVLKILRSIGSSGAFLTASIVYTASILFSLISTIVGTSAVKVTINLPGGYDYSDLYRTTSSAAIVGAIVAMIPAILIAVGIWMVYSTSIKKGNTPFGTAGLTMIKVIVIIALVGICIAAVLVLIALLFVGVRGSDLSGLINEALAEQGLYGGYYYGNIGAMATGAVIAAFIFLAGVMTLVIFFFAKLLKTINTVKRSANTLIPSDRVSPFVAVMLFIAGGFVGIAALASLASGLILAGISSALSSVVYFIFGVLIFKYRNQMRAYMMANAQPYAQVPPQYSGASYQQVTGVTCPRCNGVYASNLASCPYCGLPRQNY